MTDFQVVFAHAELSENKSQGIELGSKKVLLCKAGGEVFAVENRCTHQDAELEGGRIRGCFISCPLHGAKFDLRNGAPMSQLTRIPLATYDVRVVDGMIEVAVE